MKPAGAAALLVFCCLFFSVPPGQATQEKENIERPGERESVQQELEVRLSRLEDRLHELKLKLEREGEKADARLLKDQERLQQKAREARKRLEHLKTEAPERMKRLRTRIESDLEDLRKSLEKASPKAGSVNREP